MAREIRTEILINATPERVWNVLTDFEKFPVWNPFIISLSGEVKPGNRIQVQLQAPGKKTMKFTPRVLVFNPRREFRWIGKLFVRGIFDGEHIFELMDNGNGTTAFVQREKFRGLLVPFLKKMLEENTAQGFALMNEKLKEQAEK